MAESAHTVGGTVADRPGSEIPTLIAEGLQVHYRIYEDQRPTLRRIVANRFRPRPFRAVHALRGVSITSYPGDSIGIIGRNGSGKSTLLRALAGLLPVSAGSVRARSIPVLLGVSAALQQELSGRRNIYLGCTALGMSRSEVHERFEDIVDFAGLQDFIDMPLRAYSSGMKARLQFSIATTVKPEILLVDEVLAVGDAEFKRKSERRMRELLGQAGTLFLVSHSLGMVSDLCERVIWLDQGQVRSDGSPDQVIGEYTEEVGE